MKELKDPRDYLHIPLVNWYHKKVLECLSNPRLPKPPVLPGFKDLLKENKDD
jgi:hypothetical protein